MMNIGKHITLACIAAAALLAPLCASAEEHGGEGGEKELAIGDIITEHVFDSYWWHITTYKGRHISMYLPIIARSEGGSWHVFSSRHLAHGEVYRGFRIAAKGEKHEGKVVATSAAGEAYRPWDISLTKNALALTINSAIMLALFLGAARWYKRRPKNATPSGFVCAVEMLVMDVEEGIVHASIGKDYKRYSPYLLTAFFFILINNLMGIIPIFPGGANTTGNIAITFVLALCTMVAVNLFGNREYWKEIFWPDVPVWLKVPLPIIPLIELFGVISKPFALMIRLLANIFAGHTVILAFTLLVFITAKIGVGINAGMTAFSVVLSIIMLCLEFLVAYIQAYVFTLLSAVFIGLSRPEHHAAHKK
jgi:F-type H+-transporting ATPase subunit a